jgi:hypothetical protein
VWGQAENAEVRHVRQVASEMFLTVEEFHARSMGKLFFQSHFELWQKPLGLALA